MTHYIRGITMQQAGFQQANHIADRVLSEVESVQNNVIQLLNKYDEHRSTPHDTNTVTQSELTMPTMMSSSASVNNDFKSQASHATANSVTTTDNFQMKEMFSMIQTMQEDIKKLQHAPGSRKQNKTRRTDKYCWSHGACAHESASCLSKKPGHQDTATFNNKMGGSTTRCPPVTSPE